LGDQVDASSSSGSTLNDSWVQPLKQFVSGNREGYVPHTNNIMGTNALQDDPATELRHRTVASTDSSETGTNSTNFSSQLSGGGSASANTESDDQVSLSHDHEFNGWPLLLFPESSTTNGDVALMQ
jgi:hypothetical protein